MKTDLFVHLYLDHHKQLSTDLCEMSFDVFTTHQAGLETASDLRQLEFAARSGRAVLTYNIGDFAVLHQQWRRLARDHSGIIVSRQVEPKNYGVLLKQTLRLLNSVTRDEMSNNLIHLEQFK